LLRTSDARPIAWCVIGLCIGLYLFFQGFRLLQRRHLILNTPVSKIRSAPMGLVELSGLAVGPYTMVAPITARPCYFHRTIVWEWKRQGRSNQWVQVAAECLHVPFFLDDNTAKVMVDPRGADLDLHRDFHEEFCDSFFTMKEEAPANVRDFLLRYGISTTNKIKVEEFCIKPKNALFLLGTLDENPGLELTGEPIRDEDESLGIWEASVFSNNNPLRRTALSLSAGVGDAFSGLSLHSGLQHDPAYDAIYDQAKAAAAARVVHLSSDRPPTAACDMSQQQKIAAALLKAGISNPAAWSAAGVSPSDTAVQTPAQSGAAYSASSSQVAARDEFDPHPPVVLKKGTNNSTFLISWRSQREVASALGWKCALMIWGGPVLSLASLYLLLNLLHWT